MSAATTEAAVAALSEIGQELARAGLSAGTSGNVSVRAGDRIFISATNTELARLDAQSVSELDLDGRHLQGPQPSKEAGLHAGMYQKNPQHSVVIHTHSPYAVAFSCLQPWSVYSAIPPVTPYFVMRVGQAPLLSYRAPGSADLAQLILASPQDFDAALLANHGPLVSRSSAREALEAIRELEEACRIALLTQGHNPTLLSDAQARELAERYNTRWNGVASKGR